MARIPDEPSYDTGRKAHLHEELRRNSGRVTVETTHGRIVGGRADRGQAVFLEIPYALPPERFSDPLPLPPDFVYEQKEYIHEASYAAQPMNDGQAAGMPFPSKVGLGEPTENPLFLNIVVPSSFPSQTGFPVKIYIHGGFLQFGSPHGLSGQAQFVSETRGELWVNIGYRLSAFGFLASDEPPLDGNYGFKDQWLALLWIKDNISSFGGNPDDITLTGLSAGAHSVHQILHHASHLPPGVSAPFHRASLQSNSIVNTPKTPAELRPQYAALCLALGLDPSSPATLPAMRDPAQVPWKLLTDTIERLGAHGTFRGCFSAPWLAADPMEWQRSGALARALTAKGVRSITVGDLTEEWYLYSIAHPIRARADIVENLDRYYPAHLVQRILAQYAWPPAEGGADALVRMFGEVLSDGQVHMPVRMLVRDLAGVLPVLRYEIRWTPEQLRPPGGYVTHGGDRSLWALREPNLDEGQIEVARRWLDAVEEEVKELESGRGEADLKKMLTLKEDKTIEWTTDARWEDKMELVEVPPGESESD